jgi:DNA-binding NtrC family response regulator
MPEMDGLELLPKILQIHPQLPVVFLTVEASLDTAIRAMNLGAVGYLLKPIDPEQILSRVQGILQERKARQHRNQIVREIQDIMGDIQAE